MGILDDFFGKNDAPARILQDSTRQHRYSFSGADARAFVYFEGMEHTISRLEALHTVSVSVHEAKGQARALGHRGIKGLARGVRTIAGSMVLTVIEDNPLRPLMQNLRELAERGDAFATWPGWSIDRHEKGTGSAHGGELHFSNRIGPLLPPFNLLIEYVAEGALWSPRGDVSTSTEELSDIVDAEASRAVGGRKELQKIVQQISSEKRKASFEGAGVLIRGMEFIDEGMVTSVNDIVTEITLSFIAQDLKPLSAQVFDGGVPYLPVNEDQRKTWELQQKLFADRNATRVRQQETAIQTVTSSGVEN